MDREIMSFKVSVKASGGQRWMTAAGGLVENEADGVTIQLYADPTGYEDLEIETAEEEIAARVHRPGPAPLEGEGAFTLDAWADLRAGYDEASAAINEAIATELWPAGVPPTLDDDARAEAINSAFRTRAVDIPFAILAPYERMTWKVARVRLWAAWRVLLVGPEDLRDLPNSRAWARHGRAIQSAYQRCLEAHLAEVRSGK